MLKSFLFFLFSFLILVPKSHALIELSGEYGLSQQVYGSQRNNNIESTTIGGSIALYLFDRTAIELNYNQTETITDENRVLSIDDTYNLTKQINTVQIYSYGIGIRQAFASRKSRFRPSLSLGYARQFTSDSTTAYFTNTDTGENFSISNAGSKSRYDSVFGTFSLEIMLTRRFSLRGSVKTIFKAFEFNRAQDNMNYLFGFSWYL
ncbi:MAG: hypothetical protein CME60_05410 [Halobacteriovoraceae bacterium]|nr:hypothetical protein [Halobacteriovoraceae bacterium]